MNRLILLQAGTQETADAAAKARTDPILLAVIVALVAAAAVGSAYLMTRQGASDNPETTRVKWGAAMTAIAFVAIVAVFGIAVWMFDTANDVVATVGVITGLMGTVIGTFFGVQVGSSGTQTATNAAVEAARFAGQAQAEAKQAAESAGRAVQEAAAAKAGGTAD
jgi:flagellar basal body-associated protein FliL